MQTPDTWRFPSGVIADARSLGRAIEEARKRGQKVAMTNGCFDLLHAGHVQCLTEARAHGDYLVVAVNSDDSVRRLKGPDRPIIPLKDRLALLAELRCVNCVIAFADADPGNLYEQLKPDVIVKGGDYSESEVVTGGKRSRKQRGARVVGYLDGRSTSGIIERIRQRA